MSFIIEDIGTLVWKVPWMIHNIMLLLLFLTTLSVQYLFGHFEYILILLLSSFIYLVNSTWVLYVASRKSLKLIDWLICWLIDWLIDWFLDETRISVNEGRVLTWTNSRKRWLNSVNRRLQGTRQTKFNFTLD